MKRDGSAMLILLLALIYIISLIDIVPDVIPVAGWVDDVIVTLVAGILALGAGSK